MRLTTFLVALLMLLTGWWLGWYTHDRFEGEPEYGINREPSPAPRTLMPEPVVSVAPDTGSGRAGTLADMLGRHDFGAVVERYAALQHESGEAAMVAREEILADARG